MIQVRNIKEIESAINENGEMIISKNDENNVVVMSIEEYRKRILDEEIEKHLLKAEDDIENNRTQKATEVFKELEEKYGLS